MLFQPANYGFNAGDELDPVYSLELANAFEAMRDAKDEIERVRSQQLAADFTDRIMFAENQFWSSSGCSKYAKACVDKHEK